MLFQKECRCTKIYVPGKQTANEQFQPINLFQSTRLFGSMSNKFLCTEKKNLYKIMYSSRNRKTVQDFNKQTEKKPLYFWTDAGLSTSDPSPLLPQHIFSHFPIVLSLIITFYIQLTLCPLSPCSSKPTFPCFLGPVREAPPRVRDEWPTRTTSLSSLHTAEQNPSGQKATPPDLALQQQRSEMQLQRPSGAS